MDAPHGPISWYAPPVSDAPFAEYYALDPSENPTVRPTQAAPEEDVRIPGESHLIVVARRINPMIG